MTNTSNTVLAAIDIGSSAIRMDIAEEHSDGTLYHLESLKKGVQLGKDVFSAGSLSEESIRAACEALRDFKKVMDSYGVARYRAVATSAVREATNTDTFLDRILMSTGLNVEVIDGSEENRLTYSAVLESLPKVPGFDSGGEAYSLIVEVGGGSTDVTLLRGLEPVQSGTYPLGPVRLWASTNAASGTRDQRLRIQKRQIANVLTNIKRALPIKEAVGYIAVGGDVRFAARAITGSTPNSGPWLVAREAFTEFVESLMRLTVDALVQKFSFSYADVDDIVPSLWTYLQLLNATQAQQVVISHASIRTGILQDLAPAEKGKRRRQLTFQILSAARSLGRKYQYDESHAERVRELAELVFDEVKGEHRLTDTHRLYLQVASLLHDIGLFISPRAHHKHSFYLISTSDLFGLRRKDLELIANVARYHRRALPRRSHGSYVSLERDDRVIVSKLAAILRVANALDKGNMSKVTDLKVVREDDQIVLVAQNVSDLTMERVTLAGRSNLFTEVFGKKIALREAVKAP